MVLLLLLHQAMWGDADWIPGQCPGSNESTEKAVLGAWRWGIAGQLYPNQSFSGRFFQRMDGMRLIEKGDVQYLMGDYLAETTMAIMARQRAKETWNKLKFSYTNHWCILDWILWRCNDGEISWSRYQDPKVGFARDILFMIGKHAHVPWLDDWIDCFLQLFIWKKLCHVVLRLWRKKELRPCVVWYDCYHFQLGLIVFCLIHCKFMQTCLPGSLQCWWHESLGL